jgi:hypothetical protein
MQGVRTAWGEESGKWCVPVVCAAGVLTGGSNPRKANRNEAAHGGRIAGTPRCEIEIQTEKKIVSPLTAKKVLAAREAEKVGEEGS